MDGLSHASYSGHQPDYHSLRIGFPATEQGEHNLLAPEQQARDPNSVFGKLDAETQKDVAFVARDIVTNMAGNKNLHNDLAELARKDMPKAIAQVEENLAANIAVPNVQKTLAEARETRKDIDYAADHLVKHLVADKADNSGLAVLARRDPAMAAEIIREDLTDRHSDPHVKERLAEAHQARLAEGGTPAASKQQKTQTTFRM